MKKQSSATKSAPKPARVSGGKGPETRGLAKFGKAIKALVNKPAVTKANVAQLASARKIQQKAPHLRALPSLAQSSRVPRSTGTTLTAKQLRELEEKLRGLHIEISASLSGKSHFFNAQNHNESLIKGDDAEVAEKQRQSNAALQELDMLKNRLHLIARALRKIEEGIYGFCEETEEPIGFERLLAVPWARYGVKVQEMRERRLRDFRINRLRTEF